MAQVDVRAWLDGLDAARQAGLPRRDGYPSVASLTQDDEYPTDVLAQWSDGGASTFAECYGEERAALIVAAVNAVPSLTAALRAVLDLADAHDRIGAVPSYVADDLRAAVAGALWDGARQTVANALAAARAEEAARWQAKIEALAAELEQAQPIENISSLQAAYDDGRGRCARSVAGRLRAVLDGEQR